jgi:hypothetical protein
MIQLWRWHDLLEVAKEAGRPRGDTRGTLGRMKQNAMMVTAFHSARNIEFGLLKITKFFTQGHHIPILDNK